jgi:hypothetical protein
MIHRRLEGADIAAAATDEHGEERSWEETARRLNLLTEQDIVDRAAEPWRWYWRVWLCCPLAILLLWVLALYPPSWTIFLRAHVEFLWGVLAGSLLQVPGWLRDRWRWMKLFSWS